jgi:NDP-sugar pyrophosphorylase family protein
MERHCLVLAGGLGTRLRSVTNNLLPKALVPIAGRPFLFYKLASLKRMQVTDVWILAGAFGEQIDDYVKSLQDTGLKIRVEHDGEQLLGTAGAISRLVPQLPSQFWITYGDTYVMTDLAGAERFDKAGLRVMCVWENRDRIEVSNVSVSQDLIEVYEKNAKQGSHRWIDYGLLRLWSSDFQRLPAGHIADLTDIATSLANRRLLAAWEVGSRFWEVGTPDSYLETKSYLSSLSWTSI